MNRCAPPALLVIQSAEHEFDLLLCYAFWIYFLGKRTLSLSLSFFWNKNNNKEMLS